MANCVNPTDPEGAVNFLEFNCEIFGREEVRTPFPWLDNLLNYARAVETSGEVEGFSTPGAIISSAWPFIFGIAGLILFAMLLWGSMEIMFGAATPKSAESGKTRITYAIIGFIIIFMVFWIGQIIQQIFGINFGIGPMPTP